MGIEIVEYVKPEKARAANPYDEVIAAVGAAGGESAVKLTEDTAKEFRSELRKMREAASHAGYRVRSVTPVAADATSGTFTIRAKVSPVQEADAEPVV